MQDINHRFSKKTLIASLVLHVILLGALVYSYQSPSKPKPFVTQASQPIVNAITVDEKALEKTMAELKARKSEAENTARANLKKLEREKKALEAKRQKEEEQLAKLKAEQIKVKQEEALRLNEEKAKLATLEKEKKETEKAHQNEKLRLAKLKKEQELIEKARQAEEQRLAELKQKRAEEDEQKKREAARLAKVKAEQAAKQKEAARLAQIESIKAQAEVQRYVALIKGRIEQQWRRPLQSQSELSCTLFVKLLANGEVAYAEVRRSSGNASFDDSALRAVYKASPLPIPEKGLAFDQFRELILPFQPEA